ncbi:hypothetical protein IE81DRAFT_258482 [Ceraceosorus guamensis]|uniref:Uncharacterized protein n=1 Tax=Ceraceosorus guamensis TaxID=1522189 RepID=A0A316VQG2_9BASI|nr:hypothetical protein IE81DRAFT_258482 [Ceraceosorus guamensis]PWN39762.1 hypothetical protein IE81DRAFT_258482 [Ceraceosorus guamensis]
MARDIAVEDAGTYAIDKAGRARPRRHIAIIVLITCTCMAAARRSAPSPLAYAGADGTLDSSDSSEHRDNRATVDSHVQSIRGYVYNWTARLSQPSNRRSRHRQGRLHNANRDEHGSERVMVARRS